MTHKKIIVLIISSRDEPYDLLENTIKTTWASIAHPNVNVLYLHAQPDINPHVQGSDLIVNGNEGLYNIGYKTLNAFTYCLEHFDFDYIYRTNLSSYVHLAGLIRYADNIALHNIYRGVIGNHNGIKFASGSGYLISKDLISTVVQNAYLWDHISVVDDVAIAKVLQSLGMYPEYVNRLDILDENQFMAFDPHILNTTFHFRCKSIIEDRMHDVKTMNMIHEYAKLIN